MPGAKLADLVTKHMRTVFTEYRKALKSDVDYDVQYTGSGSVGVDGDCSDVVTLLR